jgi:Spy/CpxP family protein refolding chaperone
MKRVVSSLCALSLVALIASPLVAQEAKAKKKAQQGGRGNVLGQLAGQLEKANLTDDQKKQIEEIKTKYAGKFAEAQKGVNAVLTREQRQARQAAVAKAREEGKKGEELKAAGDAALTLSDEQKKSLAEAEAKMKAVQTEIRAAVLAVLTEEQKQAAGLNRGKKKAKKDA